MSPGWSEEVVRAGECVTAGGLGGARRRRRPLPQAQGGSSRKRRISADSAAAGPGLRPPRPARSAERDSALTHRTRCQWISPVSCSRYSCRRELAGLRRYRCLLSLSCTAEQSCRFKQSKPAFTAFESRPSGALPCFVFFAFKSAIVH
uniref:Uncharacterized protein n=1 Tax=Pan troglodytes TaxID=9598 RepID=A0A2I3RQE4_PANTR